MPEVRLIRAGDNSALITLVNVAKRLNTAVSGLQADLKSRKSDVTTQVLGMFTTDRTAAVDGAATGTLATNYKLESTKVAKADGVDVEIPDGIVQCQMKVVRKELSPENLVLARGCRAVAYGLTEVRRVVASLDPQQALLYLTTHPDKVSVLPCGASFGVGVHEGIAEGDVPGMVYRDAYYPADSFIDKVNALTPEARRESAPFIDLVLNGMLDPVLVFGNRTGAS